MSCRDSTESKSSEKEGNFDSNQEVRLFCSLNSFIALVSHNGSKSTTVEGTGNKKDVANFLRLNLLSYLRHWQQYTDRVTAHREVLIQWWVTLLNFLNSELIVDTRNQGVDSSQSGNFSELMWNTDTVSVSLECISRIMSTLLVLPIHRYEETEIYSHHILLTIHYVTNQIIFNSKHIRISANDQSPKNKKFLHFIKNYSTLLRAFLGKLNAYAFFYLPDDFHYDTQLLLVVCPELAFADCNASLFPWKRRKFDITGDQVQKVDANELENRDTRFFKIVVSYMKNESIFTAFYWHYWYIVLRFISSTEGFENLSLKLDIIPGSTVLLNYATTMTLERDLSKFNKFVKLSSIRGAVSNSGISALADTMPDSTTSAAANDNILTSEMLNDFIFSNFGTIRLWECLRSLAGCFHGSSVASNLLTLHDSFQLRYVTTVSAYDCDLANVLYNKLLQFILFQFKSTKPIDFLNWNTWCTGLLAMLQTLNANCQTVALLSLFNIWDYLPVQSQRDLASSILEDHWHSLTIETNFHLVKVIFLKFLVFRLLPVMDAATKIEVKFRLQILYGEMIAIKETLHELPDAEQEDVLTFYGNKKFFFLPNKSNSEEHLMHKVEKQARLKSRTKIRSFPSVVSTANLRPSLILKNGRYPYDVFDEMVLKATLLLSERKRRELETPLPPIDGNSSTSLHDPKNVSPGATVKPSSISSAIGSWFTKISSKGDQHSVASKHKSTYSSKPTVAMDGMSPYRTEKGFSTSSDTSLSKSESAEILSMYSNVSSLATGNSSIDDFNEKITDEKSAKRISNTGSNSKLVRNPPSSKDGNKSSKSKKKLLAPVELKYSSSVVDKCKPATLFKPVVIPCGSIAKKIESANIGWSVTTAKTYDKPLPIPNSDEIDSVIEDLNYDNFGLGSSDSLSLDFEKSGGGVSTISSKDREAVIPRPVYGILFNSMDTKDETSTADSELLEKFRQFSLGKNNKEGCEKGNSSICRINSVGDLYSDEIHQATFKRNGLMCLRTKFNKIALIIRMYNSTMQEYLDYLNFVDHESLVMDFEVRPPSYSPSTIAQNTMQTNIQPE